MKTLEALRGLSVYLDSNALIYAVETDAAAQPPAVRGLLQEVDAGRIRAHGSLVVRSEVMVHPLRNGNRALVDIYQAMLGDDGPITMVELDASIADHAALLRAQHQGLKLADALHLASALHVACRCFISSDRALQRVAHGLIEVISLDELAA